MKAIISPLVIVFLSLSAGYIYSHVCRQSPSNLKKLRIILQRIALLGINPLAFLGAVWIAPISNLRIIALPVVAAVAIISGGLLAFLYSRVKKLGRKQTGSIIPVGGFTNIGSIGAIVVYFFLGEAGFSLIPLYKLFEELLYYGIGFPIAKSFSVQKYQKGRNLKAVYNDPFILTMLTAITVGLFLNLTGISRPLWYSDLNEILIPLATVILLISIGIAFRFTKMKKYLGHAAVIALIKTSLVPAIAFYFAVFLGLGTIENGLVLKVVLILAAMPAGFVSLVPPTVYDLDIDFSNTAWLATMLSLFYSLPVLAILLPLIK